MKAVECFRTNLFEKQKRKWDAVVRTVSGNFGYRYIFGIFCVAKHWVAMEMYLIVGKEFEKS